MCVGCGGVALFYANCLVQERYFGTVLFLNLLVLFVVLSGLLYVAVTMVFAYFVFRDLYWCVLMQQ